MGPTKLIALKAVCKKLNTATDHRSIFARLQELDWVKNFPSFDHDCVRRKISSQEFKKWWNESGYPPPPPPLADAHAQQPEKSPDDTQTPSPGSSPLPSSDLPSVDPSPLPFTPEEQLCNPTESSPVAVVVMYVVFSGYLNEQMLKMLNRESSLLTFKGCVSSSYGSAGSL